MLNLTDQEFKDKIRVEPSALHGLEDFPVDLAAEVLDKTLEKVHIPTDQEVAAMRRILAIAVAHALTYYTDTQSFVAGAYATKRNYNHEPTTVMMTSEAGIGKSVLCAALKRLIGPIFMHKAAKGLPALPVVGGAFIRIHSDTRRVDVLNLLAQELGIEVEFARGDSKDSAHARKLLYMAGCMFIVVDELQFLTQSANANTVVAKTIEFLRSLGVPIFFVGNYSLAHKLQGRPQQDKQRYLTDPLIILPDPVSAPEYVEMLNAYARVSGGVVNIREIDREMFHWYTGGNKRVGRHLLVQAYRISRVRCEKKKVATHITMADIQEAYAAPAFSSDREDIEICRKQLLEGRQYRQDLWCPFELPKTQQSIQSELYKKVQEAHLANAVLTASMTQPERAAAKSIADTFGFETPAMTIAPKPKSSPLPKTLTALLSSVGRTPPRV